MDEIHPSFSRLLRLAKARRGWERPVLTERLGVSKQQMTNWRVRGVPPKDHQRIAKLLDISVDELLGEKATKAAASQLPVLLITQADIDALDSSARSIVEQLIATLKGAMRSSGVGPGAHRSTKS